MSGQLMMVEVVYAEPQSQVLLAVEVPLGATVMEAIDASDILDRVAGLVIDPARLGVFGRRAKPDAMLKAGDRVEIYRPLIADPKEVRRARAAAQKENSEKPG